MRPLTPLASLALAALALLPAASAAPRCITSCADAASVLVAPNHRGLNVCLGPRAGECAWFPAGACGAPDGLVEAVECPPGLAAPGVGPDWCVEAAKVVSLGGNETDCGSLAGCPPVPAGSVDYGARRFTCIAYKPDGDGIPVYTPVKTTGPDDIPACLSEDSASCIWVRNAACCDRLARRASLDGRAPFYACPAGYGMSNPMNTGEGWCREAHATLKKGIVLRTLFGAGGPFPGQLGYPTSVPPVAAAA